MRPDIYVFTNNMQRAYDVLKTDHDAKRFSERANQMKLPNGKIVEFRPMKDGAMRGLRIEQDQHAHLWRFAFSGTPYIDYMHARDILKTRFAPPGYEGRLHMETGQL